MPNYSIHTHAEILSGASEMTNANELPTKPQLAMVRVDLDDLPAVELPDGYSIRSYRPGDAAAWCEIITESFGGKRELSHFEGTMRADFPFRPERILFVTHGDELVATASAWCKPDWDVEAGYIHMVGCRPSHAGKGLGYAVSLAVLHRHVEDGRKRACLHTDDFRVPALKTYLRLGFVPRLVHENQRERWRAALENLGRNDLLGQFKAILDAPLYEPPQRFDDAYDLSRFTERRRWHPTRKHLGGLAGGGDIDALGDESLYKSSTLGEAGIDTPEVRAGSEQPFTLWFRGGDTPLRPGAQVAFYVRGQQPLGTPLQHRSPDAKGFVEIVAPSHLELAPRTLGFRVVTGELRKGHVVELRVGHTAGFTWTPLTGKREFKVVILTHPDEPQMRLPEPLVVDVLPLEAERLEALVSCTPRHEDTVKATITIRDRFDNRVPVDGEGRVRFGDAGRDITFVRGIAQTTMPPPDRPTRLVAEHEDLAGESTSNVCVPETDLQLFVGDLHAHDFLNEAEGYSDEVYRWAIEDRALDFISVPLQSHSYHDNERWTIVKSMNERFLDEGRFVTFLAFEWQHSHYGDKVIHYLSGDQPYLPVDDPRYSTPVKLYEALRGSDAIIISHHPGYALDLHVPGTDWDAIETDVDRLAEIWSMHGSSEGYDREDRPLKGQCFENSVMFALKKGLRLGLVAGSDTHRARPGGAVKEPRGHYPGGLCAIWAESLTRRSIFQALKQRRTYALTGSRIVLDMRVNGEPMGSEIPATKGVSISVDAWGQTTLSKVEIMKNGQVWKTAQLHEDECHLVFEDDGPDDGASAFYHCRVTQADGHLAVCSPVWLG